MRDMLNPFPLKNRFKKAGNCNSKAHFVRGRGVSSHKRVESSRTLLVGGIPWT